MLAGKVYSGRLVRPALFGGSPEWTAGVRRHPTAVVAAAVVLLVCACIPYAGFPALYLAAAACGAFYAANEPLQLRLGAAGFLVPPLLPLSLCLVVSYLLRAERNLSRYLYDYD